MKLYDLSVKWLFGWVVTGLFLSMAAITVTVLFITKQMVVLLPCFILTDNNDLTTEYQYRYEGINDYFVSLINIPELVRRILYFVEDAK